MFQRYLHHDPHNAGDTISAAQQQKFNGLLVDGLVITRNTLTFALVDAWDEAAQAVMEENGHLLAYQIGYVSSIIGRESLIAAVTMGVGAIARGGMAGGSIIAGTANMIARYKSAVRVARIASGVINTYEIMAGGYSVGSGLHRLATKRDPWALLDIGVGSLRLLGGLAGAKDLRYFPERTGGRFGWRPIQEHHAVAQAASRAAPARAILAKYGHSVDDPINKIWMPHRGTHPRAYYDFVNEALVEIDDAAQGSVVAFDRLLQSRLLERIRRNPDLLRRCGWPQ